ncbi:TonB-dependent receptor plug domain-containing protein [candidate division KSB1 bacterium]
MLRSLSKMMIILLLSNSVSGQEKIKEYKLDPITVTATRLDQKFAVTRNVTVFDQELIEKMPVQSIAQLLNYALGVSMNSRGNAAVQSDPSLRGAGFDQVLVLLDGVRMNDPQTGHHNINLPVTVNDIERVEVLRGQSSALYGPDAFGGVINIITKSALRERIFLEAKKGTFNTNSLSGSFSAGNDKINTNISFETSRSDGHLEENTDYKINSVNIKNTITAGQNLFTVSSGILEKKFGAYNFYVNNGKEYEQIQSFYSGIKGTSRFSEKFTTTFILHYKQHRDHYAYSRYEPWIYTADHTTERITGEWSGNIKFDSNSDLTVGIESNFENIKSNRLGNYENERYAVFAEYGNAYKNNFLINTGIRLDHHSEWDTEINPTLSLGYIFNSGLIARSSVGRSFRAPTFIEMYSPAKSGNTGSPNLKPERATAYDAGFEYTILPGWKGSTTYFIRDQKSAIDWISDDEVTFYSANIFEIKTQGIEQEFDFNINRYFDLKVFYTFLTQDKKQKGVISRYIFTHPRHHFSIIPMFNIGKKISFESIVSYKDRPNLSAFWIADAQIRYGFSGFQLCIEGLNLTDTDYKEMKHLPSPGRSIHTGIKIRY